MFSFYALLKDYFEVKVLMLQTDTDYLIQKLILEDIKQAMTENKLIRDEFILWSVSLDQSSRLGDIYDPNANVVGKFKV